MNLLFGRAAKSRELGNQVPSPLGYLTRLFLPTIPCDMEARLSYSADYLGLKTVIVIVCRLYGMQVCMVCRLHVLQTVCSAYVC